MSAEKKTTRVRSARGSKAKGSNYERELAAWINEAFGSLGVEARRALLSGGGRKEGGTDVEGMPGVHLEAKRVEKLSFREAMAQAEKAVDSAKVRPVPIVVTRKNNEPTNRSLVLMRLDEFAVFYRAWLLMQQAGQHQVNLQTL